MKEILQSWGSRLTRVRCPPFIKNVSLPLLRTVHDNFATPPYKFCMAVLSKVAKLSCTVLNTFVISTVTFLNKFVIKCESKFIEFETKLQRVEASLAILENKLSSIPGLPAEEQVSVNAPPTPKESQDRQDVEVPEQVEVEVVDEPAEVEQTIEGVRACEDIRYRKFFKMVQFGVPPPAVKQKMNAEGLNPEILDDPNKILPDGVEYREPTESDDE